MMHRTFIIRTISQQEWQVQILSDFDLQSLYDLVEDRGIHLENFRDEFAVGHAPNFVAEALGEKEGTALLKTHALFLR